MDIETLRRLYADCLGWPDDAQVCITVGAIRAGTREAVAREREACATLAEAESCEYALAHPDLCCGHTNDGEHEAASRIAAFIRERTA